MNEAFGPNHRHRNPRCARRSQVALLTVLSLLAFATCDRRTAGPYIRLDGKAPHIEDAPNARALLITFWATWCVPCQHETPGLLALAKRPPRDLAVVVASHDDALGTVESFLGGSADSSLHLRIDEGRRLADALNVTALPASILIVDGHLVARFQGLRDWNSAAERELLSKLIEQASERFHD